VEESNPTTVSESEVKQDESSIAKPDISPKKLVEAISNENENIPVESSSSKKNKESKIPALDLDDMTTWKFLLVDGN
jgi:hypothetical protein